MWLVSTFKEMILILQKLVTCTTNPFPVMSLVLRSGERRNEVTRSRKRLGNTLPNSLLLHHNGCFPKAVVEMRVTGIEIRE